MDFNWIKKINKLYISLFITLFVFMSLKSWAMAACSIIELMFIFIVCDRFAQHNKSFGYWLNVVLLFVFFAQVLVYYFTGEFISKLMLENVDMVSNLGDSLKRYVFAIVVLLLVLFMPLRGLEILREKGAFVQILVLYIGSLLVANFYSPEIPTSPMRATTNLLTLYAKSVYTGQTLKETEKEQVLAYFHKEKIEGTDFKLSGQMPEKPNVVLIFTEGLSAEVLDVYNNLGLNLTPNLNELHDRSVVFDNYYNHTAATFRALRGQLYSAFQYRGGVENKNALGLISLDSLRKQVKTKALNLIDILRSKGYKSVVFNTEPSLENFSEYLKTLGADTVVCGDFGDLRMRTDQEMFELMGDVMLENQKDSAPYFYIFYNMGTHHGFDSPDLKYGDASNWQLNKFHNYDNEFGKFFRKMEKEKIFENTILVFTADHAAYPEPDYKSTFGSVQEGFISKIPLFFYTKNCSHQVFDAKGRNSLDIAPTLLDVLGFEDSENYFVGSTLLGEGTDMSRVCAIGDHVFILECGKLVPLEGKSEYYKIVMKNYSILLNE